jgi:hypothetical protein
MKKGMFLAMVFSLAMAACDREEHPVSGKDVLVQVRMVGISGDGEEDVTRSASEREPETVITPISDGMVLEMWMERDTSLLRAGKLTLGLDSYFRVIALKTGTKEYVSHDDFTINSGAVSGTLRVPDNVTYDFICYSYNDDNSLSSLSYSRGDNIPDTEVLDAMSGTKDLLYQKITMPVSGSAPTLTIELGRVMAQIKLQVNCSYNGWKIVGVDPSRITLGTVYSGGTIGLTDGAVASSAGASGFTWPTISGNNMVEESNSRLVMPKAASELQVSFTSGAITRESPLSAIPTLISRTSFFTELKSGYSYRFCMNLRTTLWAGSNIYWDATSDPSNPTLTFDPHQTDGSLAPHKNYVGTHFRWGSLVGIETRGPEFSNSVPVYVPNGSGGWTESSYNAWGNVPYWNSGNTINNTQYASFKGDICEYLSTATGVVSGNYRMPKLGEFGYTLASGGGSGWVTGGNFNTSAPGFDFRPSYTALNKGYATHAGMGNTYLPASGWRKSDGGIGTGAPNYTTVGSVGMYWTSSAEDATDTHYMLFGDGLSNARAVYARTAALSVRCVLN